MFACFVVCFLKIIKITIRKSSILPVVFYCRETWSSIFREEQILKVFENRVLRRIFENKRVEIIGG
jgi:hypothetical protein